jgi:hypothetical protein
LASKIAAKLQSDLWPHPLIKAIIEAGDYSATTRSLAAAIIRTELDQRGLLSRLIESIYVACRLPNYLRVSVGPAQRQFAGVRMRVPSCPGCQNEARIPTFLHVVGSEHYGLGLLSEVARLRSKFGNVVKVANAHHKGEHAKDLDLPTLYSTVVRIVAARYELHVMEQQARTRSLPGRALEDRI